MGRVREPSKDAEFPETNNKRTSFQLWGHKGKGRSSVIVAWWRKGHQQELRSPGAQPCPDPWCPAGRELVRKPRLLSFPHSQVLPMPPADQTQLEANQQETLSQAAHKGQPPGAQSIAGRGINQFGLEVGGRGGKWFYWDVYVHCKAIPYFSKRISANTFPNNNNCGLKSLLCAWHCFGFFTEAVGMGLSSDSKAQKILHLFIFYKLFNFYFDFISNQDDRKPHLSHPLNFVKPKGQGTRRQGTGPSGLCPCAYRLPWKLPLSKMAWSFRCNGYSIFRDAPGGTWTPLPRQRTPTRASHTLVYARK